MLFPNFLSKRSRRPVEVKRARPRLEGLETRDCPSGLAITSLNLTMLAENLVRLSGTVTDDNSSDVRVAFSGAATGKVEAAPNGRFALTTTASSLGTVTAVAQDGVNPDSDPATATIACDAPSLTLSAAYGTGRTVTLSGQVTDDDPGGLTVTLSGEVNTTVTTASDGTFSVTTDADGLGDVSATTQDVWGQNSDPATVTLASHAPVISDFQVALSATSNTVTLSGQVTAEDAGSLVVTLGGQVSTTVAVAADGTFRATVDATGLGDVTASTTDPWGQARTPRPSA
jgi:hypothetical protein